VYVNSTIVGYGWFPCLLAIKPIDIVDLGYIVDVHDTGVNNHILFPRF